MNEPAPNHGGRRPASALSSTEARATWGRLNLNPWQLTLDRHGFELRGSTYTQIFFSINTVKVLSLPYDFLSNILFSLAYFIAENTVYNKHDTQNMC